MGDNPFPYWKHCGNGVLRIREGSGVFTDECNRPLQSRSTYSIFRYICLGKGRFPAHFTGQEITDFRPGESSTTRSTKSPLSLRFRPLERLKFSFFFVRRTNKIRIVDFKVVLFESWIRFSLTRVTNINMWTSAVRPFPLDVITAPLPSSRRWYTIYYFAILARGIRGSRPFPPFCISHVIYHFAPVSQ